LLLPHQCVSTVTSTGSQLEMSDDPVDAISAAVGYEDPAFFRRLFKRRTGMTPSEYRRMFQPITRAMDESARLCVL
jgi:transcriptional regulator GlxA family with amidase domain